MKKSITSKLYVIMIICLVNMFLTQGKLQAQSLNFTGKWIIDKSKVNFNSLPERAIPNAFSIQQLNDKIIIDRTTITDDGDANIVEELPSDGTPSKITNKVGNVRLTSVKWRPDHKSFLLTCHNTNSKGELIMDINESYSMNGDSKTLIVDRVVVIDGGNTYSLKGFYQRQ